MGGVRVLDGMSEAVHKTRVSRFSGVFTSRFHSVWYTMLPRSVHAKTGPSVQADSLIPRFMGKRYMVHERPAHCKKGDIGAGRRQGVQETLVPGRMQGR